MAKEKACTISTCEYYTTNNNCERCEHDCKYCTPIGFCAIEYLQGRKCYEINSCDHKQLKDAIEQYKIAINALKKIGIQHYYLPQTVAIETLKRLGEI